MLAKQHFIEALADSEMKIRIKQSRPQNLNDAKIYSLVAYL
jgi:hypothetical protein